MRLRVSAILLAAGMSKRMGRPKQLLCIGNKTVIRHCLDAVMSSGVRDIVAVLGRQGPEIPEAISDLPVTVAYNEKPESEMADSVRTGLDRIDKSSTGVLVCLSDHPLVSSATIRYLIDVHLREPDRIIIPVYNGKRGHPSLFPRRMIEEVYGGGNLMDIIQGGPGRVKCVNVADEGVTFDMDTPEDYRSIL